MSTKMSQVIRVILLFHIIMVNLTLNEGKMMKFIKLECKDYDKSFVSFEKCQLKALARDKVAMQLQMNLKQKIDDKFVINAEFFRKSHDYRPFMYNDTMNFCGFLKNPSRFMFWKLVAQDVGPYSNLNHTCPYEDDIIVKDLVLHEGMLKALPFPSNDYMIQVKAFLDEEVKAEIKIYIMLVE